MSSINQKFCWDTGATLGRKKKKKNTKKNKNSTILNLQPIQSFSTPHYTEKIGGLWLHKMPAPNLLGRCRPTGEQISNMHIPTATPGINQNSPLDRRTNAPHTQKNWIINTGKGTCSRGVGCSESTGAGGGTRSCTLLKLLVNKDWKGKQTDRGQVKSCRLSQWATSKVKLCCKIEKQSENQHSMLTAESWLTDLWPCPRER
jgi:hypothetical protein